MFGQHAAHDLRPVRHPPRFRKSRLLPFQRSRMPGRSAARSCAIAAVSAIAWQVESRDRCVFSDREIAK
jgi:hypothetical protein